MSSVPANLRYAKSHEWLLTEPNGTALIGITDYAQNSLGDITFVQLPKIGAVLKEGDTFGVVESVKAASDLYAPVAGTVIAINEGLNSAPEAVNQSPYESGWLIRIQLSDTSSPSSLLAPTDYSALLG